VDQGGSAPPFCERAEIDGKQLHRPISAEQVKPLFPLLAKLCNYWLTFEQLCEVAKAYAPEFGYDLGSAPPTMIENGFRDCLMSVSSTLCRDERGIVKPLTIPKEQGFVKPAKKRPPIEQELIEDDSGWEQAVLEIIKDEGPIFTDDIKERIRDQRGSAGWLVPNHVGEDDIEDEVGAAVDRLENKGQIENDPEEGGWIIAER